MLTDAIAREIFRDARTIAIVGAKDVPGQPVDRVGRYLIGAGFTVLPVHPVRKEVWGLPAYASLDLVPGRVDIVNLFRAPQFCPDHARETLAMAPLPAVFWMQLGITSPEASALLAGSGIRVVDDACIMVEHVRVA